MGISFLAPKSGDRCQIGPRSAPASLLPKVLSVFHNSILRNSDNKKRVIELTLEYTERETRHYLELFGISEIILSSENKCILVIATE